MLQSESRKVLVTGGTGFVGSAVVRRLVDRGYAVRALTRPGSDQKNLASLPVEIVHGDLSDESSLEASVEGCDAVFHVAADYRLWVRDPETMHRANVDGTRSLLQAAARAGVKRMVHTSSVATLGLNADGTPADETTPSSLADMIGVYKRTKYLGEQVARELAQDGLPIVIVNPSAPIGPRDVKPTPTGRMIVDAAAGRIPAYVETGLNIVHVDDVAEGHLLAFDKGVIGERYILGGSDMRLKEILAVTARISGQPIPKICLPHNLLLPIAYGAEAIARVRGQGEPIISVDSLRMSKKLMFFTSKKAEKELGYHHRPADEAIADAVAWFRQEGYL